VEIGVSVLIDVDKAGLQFESYRVSRRGSQARDFSTIRRSRRLVPVEFV